MFNQALRTVAVLSLAASVMSLLSASGWLFDLASHFPMQFVIALLPLSLLALRQKQPFSLILLLASLGLAVSTLARTEWLPDRATAAKLRVTSDTPKGGEHYRLMSLNVQASNTAYAQIAEFINSHNPDTVLVVELTPPLASYLTAHLTELDYFFGRPKLASSGIGVYSRRPLHNSKMLPLGVASTPGVYVEQLLPPGNGVHGESVALVGIHPWAPINPELHGLRNQQLSQLGSAVENLRQPLIVAGDFNITPWSHEFRALLQRGRLKDSRVSFGIQGTWPSCLPLLSIPIDHVLTSVDVAVEGRRVMQIPGSDHCGVIADLVIY